MKKFKFLVALLAVVTVITLTGCGKKDLSKYAGTYEGNYTKLVGDSTKNTDDKFSLDLKEDGTGKHNRDGMSFDVTWSVDGEKFTMEETFVGDPIEYEGTLKDGELHLYNGDKTNDFTYEYFYSKK